MELEKLKKIIVEVLNVDEDEISEETTFIDDLGADSLDLVELMMSIEEEFDIVFSDEELDSPDMKVVGKLVALIDRKRNA